MRRAQRATSTISTFQLLGAGALLLVVVVGMAVLFAPRKPPPPPASDIRYAERPAERQPPPPVLDDPPSTFAPRRERAADRAAESPPSAQPAPRVLLGTGAAHIVRGVVRDAATRAPLPGVRVAAMRVVDGNADGIRAAWERFAAEDAAIAEAGFNGMLESLHGDRESAMTDADGAFQFTFPERLDVPAIYRVEATPRGRLAAHAETDPLGPGAAEAFVELTVSEGARVRGRITEVGAATPAPGILVVLEQDTTRRAITDDEGRYEIGGLVQGEFGVFAELANTPYRAGRTLPYRKVLIQTPDQIIENIDFTVDPAGLVWGYVTDPEGNPVRGSDVLLVTSDSVFTQAITAALNQAPPIRGRSQEDGYYELAGVPLNREWRLYAASNSHAPQLADPFVLTPQFREARVDLFLFSGTTVQGQVVEPNGRPVPDAQVTCIPAYTSMLGNLNAAQAFRTAQSDADGTFEIRELPAGAYQILARKRGYKFSTMGDPVYPDGYSPIRGVRVVLHPVDAGSNSIYGTVTTAAGDPVSGAEIRVSGIGAQSFEEAVFNTTTDSRGAYRIDGVEAGAYGMTVRAEGYAARRLAGVRLNAPTDVVLVASGVVRGRVLVRETNRPPDPPEYSVAATRISADGSLDLFNPGAMDGGFRGNLTDPEGRFELYLPEGNYLLEGRAAGLVPGREQVAVSAGLVQDNVILYLSAAGGSISGRVVTSDGKSPQGAEVVAVEFTSVSEAMLMLASGGLPDDRTQRVGEDGAFSFSGLPAGEYLVLARHTGYANGVSDTIPLAERGNVEGIEVRLGAGGAIEGSVYRNGRPLADALIVVVGEGGTQSVSSDANGRYRVDGLAAGTYQVTVTPLGGMDLIGGTPQIQSTSLEVVEGQVTRHDFGDGSGTQVIGRCEPPPPGGLFALPGFAVLRPFGFPIAEFGEILDRPERLLRLQGQIASITPGSGDFTIEDVFPGEYQLDIFYPVPGQLGAFRYVHIETVTVTGEEDVRLDLGINTF